jgi:tight adherence protein C
MDVLLVLTVSIAFAAAAGIVFALGQLALGRNRLKRRLPVGPLPFAEAGEISTDSFGALVTEHFTEARFGITGSVRQKLRLNLIRAGYFGHNAIRYYVFARVCSAIGAPCLTLTLWLFLLRELSTLYVIPLIAIAAAVGALGPDAFLSRRQASQVEEYRLNFPDLLDLLTVCVTAGLTVEASFDRIRDQVGKRSPALGRNIELMGAEMRAGRSSVDALASFADRLGLDEAASFVAVLRHSVELGSDVATALREFSEDMRARRMLLAEKKANELPVKMVIPLALGTFPVILMVILLPVILRLLRVMGH